MAEIIRLRGSPHDEVQELLPWFINGTLAPGEAERVETHLAECPDCRVDLEAERRLASEVRTLPPAAESGWAAMLQRIEGDDRRPVARSSMWRKRVPLGWAIASPFAAAAAVAVVLMSVNATQHDTQPYRALGSPEMAQSANVIVQFEGDARLRELQTVLADVSARLVDGPTDTGAYLVRVDPAKRELAIKHLRDNEMIRLAEPIDGAGEP